MKRLLFILIIMPFAGVFAQQDPMYTNYMFNKLVLNPAYAGTKDKPSMVLLYRTQWVGFEGAPKTSSFSVHTPLKGVASKVGLGLSVVSDKIGISDEIDIAGHYSYKIDMGVGRLSFGLSAQVKRKQMNWNGVAPTNPNDPIIPYTNDNLFLPNFGFGMYYDTRNFYTGLSIPKLMENKLDYIGHTVNVTSKATQKRHYFAMVGGNIELNENVKLQPSALAKYEANSPFEIDVNASVLFHETLLVGATFRSNDSYNVIAHVFFKNLRIGYGHDFTFTKLNPHHNGTHEIVLGMDLKKRSKGLDHPRYF